MREKGVGGLPVMDTSGTKAIGNISIRDVQYLLTAPNIYKDYRFEVLTTLAPILFPCLFTNAKKNLVLQLALPPHASRHTSNAL